MEHEPKKTTRYGAYGIIIQQSKLLLTQKKSGPYKNIMRKNRKNIIESSSFDCKKCLRSTLVKNFDRFVEYSLHADGIIVSSQTSNFAMKMLSILNGLLIEPYENDQKRPFQKCFPQIHALNALLRFSGITQIEYHKKDPLLKINLNAYHQWKTFTDEEKYWNLFPILFYDGVAEALGESHFMGHCFFGFDKLLHKGSSEWQFPKYQDQEDFQRYTLEPHLIGLFDLFGFIEVTRIEPEPGASWRCTSIRPTSLGLDMAKIISDNKNNLLQYVYGNLPEELRIYLHKAFSSLVPGWKKLFKTEITKPIEKMHVLKVMLCKSWKKLAVNADWTLSDLASTILNAFEFDEDHLYYFKYKGPSGNDIKAYHYAVSDEIIYADEITVGSLCLSVGQNFTFLFDFGDAWEFKLQLVGLEMPNNDNNRSLILASGGNPMPKQYTTFD